MRGCRWIMLASLLLGACTRVYQVPAPVMYGSLDPFETLRPEERTNEVAVFYATERNPVEADDPAERYGSEIGPLRFGRARVRIGDEDETWEDLHGASVGGRGLESDVVGVEEFGDHDAFVRAVDEALAASPLSDVFVFLPGYNTRFEWPVAVMGQYRHYSNRKGVFLAYCWPAKGTFWTYGSDTRRARASVPNFRRILKLLARTKAQRVHLLAYSFGAMIVNRTLVQLITEEPALIGKIGSIIYPAGDASLEGFRAIFIEGGGPGPRFTVYTSDRDLGIRLSGAMHHAGIPRLGHCEGALTDGDRRALRTIEASGFVDVDRATREAGGGMLRHQYFHQNPWVISDALLASFYWLSPAERGLVRKEDGAVWEFPSDFPERVKRIASERRVFTGRPKK